MEAKLNDALIDKIQIAQDELRSTRAVKASLDNQGRKASGVRDGKRPVNPLYSKVQKKLRKARLWKAIQAELARDGFESFLRKLEGRQGSEAAKKEVNAVRERQLELFPGFESLPVRIRSGSGYVKFPDTSVSQFLAYEAKYQARAVRNHRTAGELRQIAERVQPFASADPELPLSEAFSRAVSQPAKLALVSSGRPNQ
jgi:hypothetical protein